MEKLSRRAILGASALVAAAAVATFAEATTAVRGGRSGHAPADDGHRIYFETYGRRSGVPLVLLHGGVMAIESAFGPDLIRRFSRTRRVIAIEAQAHGHTADRSGVPITYERMADDVKAVLDHLGVAQADFFGHSMGGAVSIGMAIRHPDRTRNVTALSSGYRSDGMLPELVEMNRNPQHQPSAELIPLLPTQQDFQTWTATYANVSPDGAAGLQNVLTKLGVLTNTWPGYTEDQLRGIRAPMLLAMGDRDFITAEHFSRMASLIPSAQYAVLPGTTHMSILQRGHCLEQMMEARFG
ncbi:MAG: alpha/beta fold hydrolase [Hyphomonadaceae bacterium]